MMKKLSGILLKSRWSTSQVEKEIRLAWEGIFIVFNESIEKEIKIVRILFSILVPILRYMAMKPKKITVMI